MSESNNISPEGKATLIEKWEYASLVKNCRDAQKEYFKTRDRNILIKSKQLEKELDIITNAIIKVYGSK